MTSIFDNSSTESEDDVDYVPPGEAARDKNNSDSSDANSSDPENEESPLKTKGRKNKKTNPDAEAVDEASPSTPSKVDEKKRAEDIWNSFLSDVEKESLPSSKSSVSSSLTPGSGGLSQDSAVSGGLSQDSAVSGGLSQDSPASLTESEKLVSSSSDQAVASSDKGQKVAEVFEFAGETFTVADSPNSSSSASSPAISTSSKQLDNTPKAVAKKRGGLDSIINAITSKKQKLTTLEKTKMDWNIFKKDEGIEEDLDNFNKGKQGFVERQRFLERSDVRSFEIEKGLRQAEKKK